MASGFRFLAAAAIMICLGGGQAGAQDNPANVFITPLSSYTSPQWRNKAFIYRKTLDNFQDGLRARFPDDRLRLLSAAESSVAGIGFWPKPIGSEQNSRYLGAFAFVQCPPSGSGPPFPDTPEGRVLRIFDAYGKDTIKLMVTELNGMNDPEIAGGVIIFIYCGEAQPLVNPSAEAFALYMPRDAMTAFIQLRMKLQTLFDRSVMLPIFHGPEEIKTLRKDIIQP